MEYSLIGIVAIIQHCLSNSSIFIHSKREDEYYINYKYLMISIILFHVTDVLWGILYSHKLTLLLFVDTELFFSIMAFSLLFWTYYSIHYIETNNRFTRVIKIIGKGIFLIQIILTIINVFCPILFEVTKRCEYKSYFMRNAVYVYQGIMYLAMAVYTLIIAHKKEQNIKNRYLAIGFFGLVMFTAIVLQLAYALLPFYSAGYLISCSVLHIFVIEAEKIENMTLLKETLNREKQQQEELGETKEKMYKDPLTGVKSKFAHVDAETKINNRIRANDIEEFALVVFDLNSLKYINDTYGHEEGDKAIKEACRLICITFKRSPVYRIGGDEFVAILEGADYENRETLINEFNNIVESNKTNGKEVVSFGISEYIKGEDYIYSDVFKRADKNMYEYKKHSKENI